MTSAQLSIDHVTHDAAHHVLHEMEDPKSYIGCGGFYTALIQAMVRADIQNLRLMGKIYPAHAAAVHAYKWTENGVADLKRIAETI